MQNQSSLRYNQIFQWRIDKYLNLKTTLSIKIMLNCKNYRFKILSKYLGHKNMYLYDAKSSIYKVF